jgi:hypothetical protein
MYRVRSEAWSISGGKLKPLGSLEVNKWVQADFVEGVLLVLVELVSRGRVGGIDAPELKVSHDGDTIKASIGLSFKSFHEAVQVDGKVVPAALFPVGIGALDKERFHL